MSKSESLDSDSDELLESELLLELELELLLRELLSDEIAVYDVFFPTEPLLAFWELCWVAVFRLLWRPVTIILVRV